MVNNFDRILHFISEVEDDDTYWFLQILQRHKDVPEVPSKNSRNIKNYYIKSQAHLLSKKDEIIGLCNYFKARAYLRLTPRSYKITALHHLKSMSQMIADGNFKSIAKSYLSSSGSTNAGTEKRWIVDIDGEYTGDEIKSLKLCINNCRPYSEDDKVLAELPTRNGLHLITSPFDVNQYTEYGFEHDIHKDNPCVLYLPNF